MVKPTAKSTVKDMKDYIRANKLNKAPIRLGMKRADLITGLRKLGHWDGRHDPSMYVPVRKAVPKAPIRLAPKRKVLKKAQGVGGEGSGVMPNPPLPKKKEPAPKPASAPVSDERSGAIKLLDRVRGRVTDPSALYKADKVLSDTNMVIHQSYISKDYNGYTFTLIYQKRGDNKTDIRVSLNEYSDKEKEDFRTEGDRRTVEIEGVFKSGRLSYDGLMKLIDSKGYAISKTQMKEIKSLFSDRNYSRDDPLYKYVLELMSGNQLRMTPYFKDTRIYGVKKVKGSAGSKGAYKSDLIDVAILKTILKLKKGATAPEVSEFPATIKGKTYENIGAVEKGVEVAITSISVLLDRKKQLEKSYKLADEKNRESQKGKKVQYDRVRTGEYDRLKELDKKMKEQRETRDALRVFIKKVQKKK